MKILEGILVSLESHMWEVEMDRGKDFFGNPTPQCDAVNLYQVIYTDGKRDRRHAGRFFFERRSNQVLLYFVVDPDDTRGGKVLERAYCVMKDDQFDSRVAEIAIVATAAAWLEPERKPLKKFQTRLLKERIQDYIPVTPKWISGGETLLRARWGEFTGDDRKQAIRNLGGTFRDLLRLGASFEQVQEVWNETLVRVTMEE